ncbi:MAG: PilZ domain-containing protein [Pyrinomonadaceae bacterium]
MLPKESDEALAPSERRQSDRRKLIVNVDFEGGDATAIANTRDIGIGGLYMATGSDFEIGTPIRMRLTLDGREVSFNGKVAYTDPGQGIGVRFQNLSEAEENLLKKQLNLQ